MEPDHFFFLHGRYHIPSHPMEMKLWFSDSGRVMTKKFKCEIKRDKDVAYQADEEKSGEDVQVDLEDGEDAKVDQILIDQTSEPKSGDEDTEVLETESNELALKNEMQTEMLKQKRKSWRGVFRKYHQLEKNWRDGKCEVKTLLSRRRVYCIFFSEEKQLLWSGNAKGHIKRFDLLYHQSVADIKAHSSAINCLQVFNRYGSTGCDENGGFQNGAPSYDRRIVYRTEDENIKNEGYCASDTEVDLELENEMKEKIWRKYESDRGDLLFSCSCDNTIKIWSQEFEDNTCLKSLGVEEGGHVSAVQMLKVFDNGNKLASCSLGLTLHTWFWPYNTKHIILIIDFSFKIKQSRYLISMYASVWLH